MEEKASMERHMNNTKEIERARKEDDKRLQKSYIEHITK